MGYVIGLIVPIILLIYVYKSEEDFSIIWVHNKKKKNSEEYEEVDLSVWLFAVMLGPIVYWFLRGYITYNFKDSFMVWIARLFETKSREVPTFMNMGQWNTGTWVFFILYLLVLIVGGIRAVSIFCRLKVPFIKRLIGLVSWIALGMWVVSMFLLFRQWIQDNSYFLKLVFVLVELVLGVGIPTWVGSALFALVVPIKPDRGGISPIGNAGSSNNDDVTEREEVIESNVKDPDVFDLPYTIFKGTDSYHKIREYSYAVVYQKDSDPRDETEIRIVYSFTSTGASTDAGHFYF